MAFKMKGSSFYGRGNASSSKHTDANKKQGAPKRKKSWDKMSQKEKNAYRLKTYNETMDSVTADMTDKQLQEMALLQHTNDGGIRTANKWNVNTTQLQKIRDNLAAKNQETETPTIDNTQTPVEIPSTYGEKRQDFVSEQLNPDIEGLTPERKAQYDRDRKSGYQDKLTKAIINKYGKLPHELRGQDRIDAGNAMIDKDGNILPMSSITGQFTNQDL